MTAYETIRFERREHIGTLTLHRPAKLNALNPLMCQEILDLGTALDHDETLRCLVVTGAGSSFSAGLDLVEGMAGSLADWAGQPADEKLITRGLCLAKTFEWIPRLRCASVAAVRGHAYGAGCQLALACDFRILSEDARTGVVETRYGLLPDMGATFRLPRIVGEGHAREMILLGKAVDADEALRIGLANDVVTAETFDLAVAAFADRLAAQPPLAVRGARRALEASWHRSPGANLRAAVEEQAICLTSDDFEEACRAMAEGRVPHWTGR